MSPVHPVSLSWIIITNVRSTSDRGDASINVIKVTLSLTELLLRDYRGRYWTFDTWTYYDLIRHAANYRLASYYHATRHPLITPICYRRVNRVLSRHLSRYTIRIITISDRLANTHVFILTRSHCGVLFDILNSNIYIYMY